jgi:hypothetical protein
MGMNAWAIESHHATLKRLLAMLLVYAGLTDENGNVRSAAEMRRCASEPFTLSRRIRDMVLRLLVPVESATRRLIVVLASQLPAGERIELSKNIPTPNPSPQGGEGPETAAPNDDRSHLDERQAQPDSPPPCGEGLGVGVPSDTADQTPPPRLPLFALADTPKRYDWFYNPRPEGSAPWPGPGLERADPYERLDALPLMRRVAALALALDDLPHQVKRFMRWRAMRLKARAAGKFVSLSPIRIGSAPGSLPYRASKRHISEEHYALRELHLFALERQRRLDSS